MRRKFPRIRRARRVSLKPGDAVVLEVKDRLPLKVIESIREAWQRQFPGTRAIVLTDGIELRAILDQPPAAVLDALEPPAGTYKQPTSGYPR